jgi:hypothetical protein
MTLRLIPLAAVLLCGACSPPDDAPPPPRVVDLAGPCAPDQRHGAFVVEVLETYSVAFGHLADGMVPVTVLEEVLSEGACSLLRRNNPFCDPTCEPGQTCDFDGTCIPYPTNLNLGTVTIRGLVDDVVMEAEPPTFRYSEPSLTHPGFLPGSDVYLDSEGGEAEPIALESRGFAPLELATDLAVTVEEGEAVDLAWEPGAERTRLQAEVNVDQHGVTPVVIRCDFEDTGSAEIPASVVDALLGFGISGFPNAMLTRSVDDSAAVGGGCVEFGLSSPRPVPVEVSGHTPCAGPQDCPPGRTCDVATNTCI